MLRILGKLAKQFFAVSPFALVLGVGLGSRSWHKSPFQFLTNTQAEDQVVANYRDVTAYTQSTLKSIHSSQQAVEGTLAKWSAAYREGKLKPYYPAFEEEEGEAGVRSQVLNAWIATLTHGMNLVKAESTNHDWSHFRTDTGHLIDTIEAFKFSDTGTTITGSKIESQLIAKFKELYPKADQQTRAWFEKQVGRMGVNGEDFQKLAQKLRLNAQAFDKRQATIREKVGEKDYALLDSGSEDDAGDSQLVVESGQLRLSWSYFEALKNDVATFSKALTEPSSVNRTAI